ncbi:MAG: hypothetical protein EB027_06350, partial [Actinobacteria bacterium]|nr:hypothetical protein [Actinomycetota bacterium]
MTHESTRSPREGNGRRTAADDGGAARAQRTTASLETERTLVNAGELIAGIDEVGRGALAGPVCVGVVVLAPHESAEVPPGLT